MDKSRAKIEAMFDSIAPSYDLLNHLLSLNIDKIWRKKVVNILQKEGVKEVIDLAAGTADLSIAIAKGIKGVNVTGVDISEGMLAIGRQKVEKLGLESQISLIHGDALSIPFASATFQGATVSMGVRNFEDLEAGISDIYRVLQNGGIFVVLELSIPKNPIIRWFYMLYFTKLLPIIGRLTSKDKGAYSYLPSSVEQFPSRDNFLAIIERCGFKQGYYRSLCFGIATIYVGKKIV